MSADSYQPPLSPGFRFLLACLRGDPPELLEQGIAEVRAGEEDLALLAQTHSLASLVYIRAREAGLAESLPDGQWDTLAGYHYRLAQWQTELFATALEVMHCVHHAGVDQILPMKGLAVAALLWPGFLPRTMDDLDFLVAADGASQAFGALEKVGFEQWYDDPGALLYHLPQLIRGEHRVELHPNPGGSFRLPFQLPSIAGMMERAATGTLNGTPVQAPCPEDTFLTLCEGLAKDRFCVSLRQWADLYWLLTGPRAAVDLGRLSDVAVECHMAGVAGLALRFVEELVGGEHLWTARWGAPLGVPYDQLRPLLWRRLLEPPDLDLGRHALAHGVIAALLAGHAANPAASERLGDRTATARAGFHMLGGVLSAGGKAVLYAGRLAVSRQVRAGLREEILLSRVLQQSAGGAAP